MQIIQGSNTRSKVRNSIDLCLVAFGVFYHCVTKKNLTASYKAMIRLHCATSGRHTLILGKILGMFTRSTTVSPHRKSIVKNLTSLEVKDICKKINSDGFYIFPELIEPAICDHLIALARHSRSVPDNEPDTLVSIKTIENLPSSKIYRMCEEDLVKDETVQQLMSDKFFFEITKEYLKSTPILCSVKLWLSTTFKAPQETGDKEAQIFHFDMSRARWLNYFVYLSDVDEASGPHCYVKGSNNIEKNSPGHELLKRGYVRISDSDIERSFGKENIVEMMGKKGTLIIEDTRGFHKGKSPISNSRFMFEFVISNSLFGGKYSKVKIESKNISEKLKEAISDSPKTFQIYSIH